MDHAVLLRRIEGDIKLLADLAGLFSEDYPRLLAAIRKALASGDAKAVQHAAHTLKGAVSNLAARLATAAAGRLEQMGREGGLLGAEKALVALENEIEYLKPVLAEFLAETLSQDPEKSFPS